MTDRHRPEPGRDRRKEKDFRKKTKGENPFRKRESVRENYPGRKFSEHQKHHEKKTLRLKEPEPEKPVRLNRYIANSGICSRREADKLIRSGVVRVNGEIVTEMGIKVNPGDEVKFNDEIIRNEKKVYILLNKPKDFVTTTDDPHADKTVMQLVLNACKERVYPVGRLDRLTTGLLLLTNDGELAKKILHPKFEKKKIYQAELDRNLKPEDMDKIKEGLELEDGFFRADAVWYPDEKVHSEVGIEIHSGRNRIIRRMFLRLGYTVKKLDRLYYAGLTKKNLPRGKWRFLTEKEISMLKMGAYE
jgi:23S rRNA pseudouridine2605 synthase